jgi:hypothetical protein
VDPVPAPLLLRNSGSAGNRTRTSEQRRSTFFYITYINSIRTSQETQYISVLQPGALTTRPQRRSTKGLKNIIYWLGGYFITSRAIALRRLVACFPLRCPWFDPRSGHVGRTTWHRGKFCPCTSVSVANSHSTDCYTFLSCCAGTLSQLVDSVPSGLGLKTPHEITKSKTRLHGLSSRANYNDRATAPCRRSNCQLLLIEGATWSA